MPGQALMGVYNTVDFGLLASAALGRTGLEHQVAVFDVQRVATLTDDIGDVQDVTSVYEGRLVSVIHLFLGGVASRGANWRGGLVSNRSN